MATEYKIENRVLYIYLDGDLDHHLAKKVKHKCDIILKSYPIKDIEFDFKNSGRLHPRHRWPTAHHCRVHRR